MFIDIIDILLDYINCASCFRLSLVSKEIHSLIHYTWIPLLHERMFEIYLHHKKCDYKKLQQYFNDKIPKLLMNSLILSKWIYFEHRICQECFKNFKILEKNGNLNKTCINCMLEMNNYHQRVNYKEAAKYICTINNGFMVKKKEIKKLRFLTHNNEKMYMIADLHNLIKKEKSLSD